ncbi:hypothetical protein E3226_006355 [Legionella geestiana]|uniref:hypothetical protein n=1 Tax=Legionella geestiana TaxID=45065 RepID=UPI001092399D|nr:hypothetical protein [Legionella geestiana]QDQ40047.1 hypothetical protein E3226_006355 [Legionella geestiana]
MQLSRIAGIDMPIFFQRPEAAAPVSALPSVAYSPDDQAMVQLLKSRIKRFETAHQTLYSLDTHIFRACVVGMACYAAGSILYMFVPVSILAFSYAAGNAVNRDLHYKEYQTAFKELDEACRWVFNGDTDARWYALRDTTAQKLMRTWAPWVPMASVQPLTENDLAVGRLNRPIDRSFQKEMKGFAATPRKFTLDYVLYAQGGAMHFFEALQSYLWKRAEAAAADITPKLLTAVPGSSVSS